MAEIKRRNFLSGPLPSSDIRRYPPDNYIQITTSNFVSSRVGYHSFFIKKRAVNPVFCVEMVTTTSTGSFEVGIYSLKNGMTNAPKIWSGTLSITSTTAGVYKVTAPIVLELGYYVVGICTGTTNFYTSVRTVTNSFARLSHMGFPSAGLSSFHIGCYEQSLSALPNNIGNPLAGATSSVPMVCLEY